LSECLAASDSEGSNAGSNRGPASTKKMRVDSGSIDRKSLASARFARSAIAPAISTPVAPPPDDHEVEEVPPLDWIRLRLGFLERQQDAPPQIGCIIRSI
jgi:hypothetical protein